MNSSTTPYQVSDFFARSLSSHLPEESLRKLQNARVLVAGLGSGSNIAELLVRKGFGNLIIADTDVYEPHNIRQRGSLVSTLRMQKVLAVHNRLIDINPFLKIESIGEGITEYNVSELIDRVDYVIDALDLHALREKILLYRDARKKTKYVLTSPSVVNGASLWVFAPESPSYEEFTRYEPDISEQEYAWRVLQRFIPKYPPEAPKEIYKAAAYGKRTVPLDAVGVDLSAVLVVGALENLVLQRTERVAVVPKGIQVDLSNPALFTQIIN